MKKENSNHGITRVYKAEEIFSELDMELRDNILGISWSDNDERIAEITLNGDENGWQGDSHPIEIDLLIKTLEDFKKKGCSHAEIMYHCDHIGYYFYGLDIHRSTDKEMSDEANRLEKLNKKIQNKKTQTQHIKELKAELKKLKD